MYGIGEVKTSLTSADIAAYSKIVYYSVRLVKD